MQSIWEYNRNWKLSVQLLEANLGIEGMYHNTIKIIYDKAIVIIIFSRKKLKSFLLRAGTRQGYLLSPLLFNITLKVLDKAIRIKREIKGIQIGKKEVKLSLFIDDTILSIEKPKYSTKKGIDH